jgi:signal transduction histidine kinase
MKSTKHDPTQSVRESLLEERGRLIHLVLLAIVACYSIILIIINVITEQYPQAIIAAAAIPGICITYVAYNYGYYYQSKVWNSFHVTTLIALIVLYSGPDLFATALFVPTILGILMTFQGKERLTGYLLATMVLLIMLVLQIMGWNLGTPDRLLSPNAKLIEQTVNIVGAALIIVLQAVFLIKTNDTIQEKLFEQAENLNQQNLQLSEYNNELERLNRDIDQFVYSTSHDLRAPALAISGIVEKIQQEEANALVIKQDLERIQQVASRMDETISDIIGYSKNARLPVECAKVDLEAMVKELFDSLKYLKKFDIALIVDIDFSSDLWCDSNRIRSLIKNLLSNAIKFSVERPEGSWVKVTGRIDSGSCTIEITDNGEGIEKEYQPKVFEMFFRASNSAHGSGLGLYICSEIVKKLNGTISFQSQSGKGSTFRVSFQNKISNG